MAAYSPRFYRIRGVVFIEGLLGLSLIFIVIFAIRFLHQVHQAAFEERARRRFCTWQAASSGCEKPNEFCQAGRVSEDALNDEEENAIAHAQETGSESLNQSISSETKGLKRRVVFETRRQLHQPRPFVGKTSSWTTRFSLPCNPKTDQFNLSPEGAFREFQ